jgi:hypothetical protein
MTFQVVCLSIGYPLKAGHTVAAIPERAGLMALPRPGYVSNRCPHRLTQVWPLPPAQARGPGAFRPRHDSRRGARPSTRWRGAWASRTASEASTPESPGDLPAPPRPAARPGQARLPPRARLPAPRALGMRGEGGAPTPPPRAVLPRAGGLAVVGHACVTAGLARTAVAGSLRPSHGAPVAAGLPGTAPRRCSPSPRRAQVARQARLAGTPGPGRRRLPRARPERWARAGLRGHPAGLLRHARTVSAR